MNDQTIESLCQTIGKELLAKAKSHEPSMAETLWWERQAIRWLTGDQEIKAGALRFVDVFPSLHSSKKISQHLKEYLPDPADRLPKQLRLGRTIVRSALITPTGAAVAARLVIEKMAKSFIIGATLEETSEGLDRLKEEKLLYTLDLLGESTLSEDEADRFAARYVELIEYLSSRPKTQGDAPHVSVKLSALSPRFDPAAPNDTSIEIRKRLRLIFRAAIKAEAFVTIDMESFTKRDLTLKIFRDILEEEEFYQWEGAGIVAQAYLVDAEESLRLLLEWLTERGRQVTIRLVKGAYWEQEIVAANQKRWPAPVRQTKPETDATFERMTKTLLEKSDLVRVAIASHNIRSIAKAIALAKDRNTPKEFFEIQMLYGMGDEIKRSLVEMGITTRVYAPSGALLPGMAYLVRRILENSSNESFLRRSFIEDRPAEELLADPSITGDDEQPTDVEFLPPIEPCRCEEGKPNIFVNEPEPQWHKASEQDAMDAAIKTVGDQLGCEYKLVINGEKVTSSNTFESINPSTPEEVVGTVHKADQKDATAAIDAAAKAYPDWRRRNLSDRTRWLMNIADSIRERKHELAAWQMFEVGKTRSEALADVDEAIDHLNFYAIAAENIIRPEKTQNMLGETNFTRLIPRGAGVVISPWNFPLAILAGLAGSALSAGNTIAIKPSSLSPVTAALFVDIAQASGIPDGVINFIPGDGSALESAILDHPDTSFISFTGSFDVGSMLAKRSAALFAKRERFIKIVAEMGGKNAIIVDDSADLDEAVDGVRNSAFGFGGQKCSACSRVIVLDSVYERFCERLEGVVASLKIGSPLDRTTDFGPLVEKAAVDKVERYIELGEKTAKPIVISEDVPAEGFYVGPALFGDVDPESEIATDEIFGPVLSLIRAKNIGRAIDIANQSRYALTGGVYTRTPSSARAVIDQVEAGNIYVNRGITGAIVERQPFGGHKRSGLGGAKAGSADLVRELMLPQTISENIIRHGFSPDVTT